MASAPMSGAMTVVVMNVSSCCADVKACGYSILMSPEPVNVAFVHVLLRFQTRHFSVVLSICGAKKTRNNTIKFGFCQPKAVIPVFSAQ